MEALQELLSHYAGKEGDERRNLCLSWQPGTVTMAHGHQGNCSKLQGGEGRNRQRLGQCRACCLCPRPRPRQPKCQHAIRDTQMVRFSVDVGVRQT